MLVCSHKLLFQVVFILPIVYSAVMLFIKPAILLEWTRIFVPQGKRSKFQLIGERVYLSKTST